MKSIFSLYYFFKKYKEAFKYMPYFHEKILGNYRYLLGKKSEGINQKVLNNQKVFTQPSDLTLPLMLAFYYSS